MGPDMSDYRTEPPREVIEPHEAQLLFEETQFLFEDSQPFVEEKNEIFSLETLQRCIITGVLEVKNGKILQLQAPGTDKCTSCLVSGIWEQLEYRVNDIVNIQARLSKESDITKLALEILSSPQSKMCLYSSGLTNSAAEEKVLQFVPKVEKFMRKFVHVDFSIAQWNHKTLAASKGCWEGTISAVKDIEETVMEPKLGLHGKIDVTVEVTKCEGNEDVKNLAAKKLRNIIIGQLETRPIRGGLQIFHTVMPLIAGLNDDQLKAIYNVLFSSDYTVVHGKPGTGKTMFIVVLVQVLVVLNRSVLITSHTHAAVDKILLELQKRNINFLRVGKKSRISENIDSDSISATIEESALTPDDMNRLFKEELVVGSTCLGTRQFLFKDKVFDYCVLDEASQISQLEAIRPLMLCKKFVLVGDTKQLPPLVVSNRAKSLGMSESILERLSKQSGDAVSELNCQYRMNHTIMSLANRFVYDGKLVCGALNECHTFQAPNWSVLEQNAGSSPWLLKVLSTNLEDAVVVVDTGDVSHVDVKVGCIPELRGRLLKTVNLAEAALVYFVVSSLRVVGVKAEEVGVIAPYQHQVGLLKRVFAAKSEYHRSVSVNTIDQYQGQEKSVVVISCTRSSSLNKTVDSNQSSILDDVKRLTVAITRSKHKLIIIGNVQLLTDNFAEMNKLFSVIEENNKLSISNFDWSYMIRKTVKYLENCGC
ncbi:hypothetical protein PR048_008795 [Dryococelus australis]|uniref:DNA replication ATP-dependent helicase/nuclease n=1 Tax=Dryococelus australis TaxID=614101 RepID=A0ABQ9HYH4_9NEOP|nr:hypothetical protein PR048_008795 [Dryococelus australis]